MAACAIALPSSAIEAGDTIACDGVFYTIREGDSTLCLVGHDASPTLVVPHKVLHEGRVYTVTAIANRALAGDQLLTGVALPVSLQEIGDEAFAGCDALQGAIVLPEGLKRVGARSFAGCSGITALSLPSTLQSIGDDAFSGCDAVEHVFSHVPNATMVLQQVPSGSLLCVDASYAQAYSSLTHQFKTLVDVDSEPLSASLLDVDCDGIVTAADVTQVYTHLLENSDVPGDANGDGSVTSADVTEIYTAMLSGSTSGVGSKGYCFATLHNGSVTQRIVSTITLPVASEMEIVAHDNETATIAPGAGIMAGAAPSHHNGNAAITLDNKTYCTGTTTQAVLYLQQEGDDTVYYKDVTVDVKRHVVTDTLRVLSIGNSYSLDALSYVPFIMNAVAPQVYLKLDIMYLGSGALNDFYNALDSTTHAPTSPGVATSFTRFWSHGARPWNASHNAPMTQIIASQPWDVIMLQQQSNASRDYSTYQPYLNQIIEWLDEKAPWQHQYAWLITPSYPDNLPRLAPDTTSVQMFERILQCVRNVQSDTGIELLLPCGTAIQNARTTPLDSLGDQGHLFDYLHLQDGIPCLIEAYAATAALLARYGLSDQVWTDTTWVDQQWLKAKNIQEINGAPVGMSEENRAIAKQCAIKAIENPLSITTIE